MSGVFANPEVFATSPGVVIFDVDNTLYAYDPPHAAAMEAVEKKAHKLLGVGPKDFRRAFGRARGELKERLGATASSHSRLLYFQRTIELLGTGTQILMALDLEQTYWRVFLINSELFPGVRDLIQHLGSAGVRTAALTDLTAQVQFRKLIYFGLDAVFDFIVTSEEVGSDKPASAGFQLVIDKLDAKDEKVWYIGDCPVKDIAGARDFGLATLQKRHGGVSVGKGASAPDVVFDDFRALIKTMEKHGLL
jgi:putative hydrolase of the HAD superfamily